VGLTSVAFGKEGRWVRSTTLDLFENREGPSRRDPQTIMTCMPNTMTKLLVFPNLPGGSLVVRGKAVGFQKPLAR